MYMCTFLVDLKCLFTVYIHSFCKATAITLMLLSLFSHFHLNVRSIIYIFYFTIVLLPSLVML